jgi:ribosomal protein L40E
MAFLDHEGGAEFPFDKDDVYTTLIEAIKSIKGMRVDKADNLSGRILAKAGVSLMSWGENIPIYVMEVSPGITRVSVTSTPKTGVLFGGAFDLGKNRRNIEKIFDKTSTILNQKYSGSDRTSDHTRKQSLTCSKCGNENTSNAKFCAKCGEKFEGKENTKSSICPSCGKKNVNNAKFCGHCGNEINKSDLSKQPNLDDLEKLAELKEKGIITEEEFQAKKKEILGL